MLLFYINIYSYFSLSAVRYSLFRVANSEATWNKPLSRLRLCSSINQIHLAARERAVINSESANDCIDIVCFQNRDQLVNVGVVDCEKMVLTQRL